MQRKTVRTADVTISCYWSPSRKKWTYVARDAHGEVLALVTAETHTELDRTTALLLLRAMREAHQSTLPF